MTYCMYYEATTDRTYFVPTNKSLAEVSSKWTFLGTVMANSLRIQDIATILHTSELMEVK